MSSLSLSGVCRIPKIPIVIKREAKESPWNFVIINFTKLAWYYARIYANVVKKPYLAEDFKSDILFEMVQAYKKYHWVQKRSLKETIKVLKTIPVYYYTNVVKRKCYTTSTLDIDDVYLTDGVVSIKDPEKFSYLYDKYYELFLQDHYKMYTHMSDELAILFEILSPSDKLKKFMRRKKRFRLSKELLLAYFREEKRWPIKYFYEVIQNMSCLAA